MMEGSYSTVRVVMSESKVYALCDEAASVLWQPSEVEEHKL